MVDDKLIEKMLNEESRKVFLNNIKKLLPENPVCVEVGVLEGKFSKIILDHLNPKKLYLIDPWEIGNDKNGGDEKYGNLIGDIPTSYSNDNHLDLVKKNFEKEINENTIEIIKKYSYDGVKIFPDKYFDFIYIDACHLYNCVKSDLINYLPKLKDNGLMCGHDYVQFDNFGIIRAVNEFIEEYNFEFVLLNQDGTDWAIKRK